MSATTAIFPSQSRPIRRPQLVLASEFDVRHPDIPVWADHCSACGSTSNQGHIWCVDCSWDESL